MNTKSFFTRIRKNWGRLLFYAILITLIFSPCKELEEIMFPFMSDKEKSGTGFGWVIASFFMSALNNPVEIMPCNIHAFAVGLKIKVIRIA